MSIRVHIPEHHVAEVHVRERSATALERFVYENEPAGGEDRMWRDGLAAVIREAVANERSRAAAEAAE